MKKQKDIYEQLKKIKKPHVLIVECMYNQSYSKTRFLKPNGQCEYQYLDDKTCEISSSCFVFDDGDINDTVERMRDYDIWRGLKVVEVIKL